uniref:Uncharacterized protein n=1 Tax=Panagrolaimus sp. ES5 TaxID=591445 RepID=A0AC34FCU7_9BILA
MSAVTTVSSSSSAAGTGSLKPQKGASNSFNEICHSRLHSLTSMSDELDAVSLPNIGSLAVNTGNTTTKTSISSSPSVSESHKNSSVIPILSDMEASAYEDDPHVYVNLSAIESKRVWDDIDRRPNPPTPPPGTTPIRVLPTGWQEFKTPGGRTYFYNFDHGLGQWKPPRGNQMTLSLLKRQRTNDSFTSNEQDDTKNELSSSENIRIQQITTFPVENSKKAFTSHSPNLAEASASTAEEKQQPSSSTMTQSMIFPLPLPQQNNNSPMVNSVDSGLGRSSISYKNQAFGMKSIPDVMAESIIEGRESSSSKDSIDSYLFAKGNFAETAVKKGTLEKMKILDFGVKTKKKEWISAYAYLTSGHLLFYKDQKRAEKNGKHYPAPTDVCDLRGAQLSFVDSNVCDLRGAQLSYVDSSKCKDKRRKHIVDLILPNNTEYWFSCSGNEIDSWYHSLRQTINSLPVAKAYPMPLPSTFSENNSLQRRPSDSTQSAKNVAITPMHHHLIKGSSLRHSQKAKVKPTTSKETIEVGENSPTRDSIIERLLRFFRSRPSVDQLKERGIYRPEPIFGSTLAAICLHDHTNVPRFITEITRVIEEKGLGIDGIYRVSGNLSSIQKIRCQVDQDRYEILWKEDDIHVLTGAVKLFFRELSEPIFPILLNKEFMFAIRQANAKTKLKAIDDLLNKLPLVHKETLRVLILHLLKVAGNSGKNRMTIHSLAIMFGPALFSSDDKPNTKIVNGTVDKKNITKKSKDKPNDRKGLIQDNSMSSEPNQILAYKMIVYGQIVEFILTEFNKISIFIPSNGTTS